MSAGASAPLRLDLRGLEPPEPMERVLEALDLVGADATLALLLDREPHPLYRILARDGFSWNTRWEPDGCHVEIRRMRG